MSVHKNLEIWCVYMKIMTWTDWEVETCVCVCVWVYISLCNATRTLTKRRERREKIVWKRTDLITLLLGLCHDVFELDFDSVHIFFWNLKIFRIGFDFSPFEEISIFCIWFENNLTEWPRRRRHSNSDFELSAYIDNENENLLKSLECVCVWE